MKLLWFLLSELLICISDKFQRLVWFLDSIIDYTVTKADRND